MKWFTPLALFVLLAPVTAANAQTFSDQPLCVNVFNSADHEILASLQTDQFTDAKGDISYHDFVFRLQPAEKRDVCSTGPFFEGQQLRLVLKTSFPVYSCKINMNRDVVIESHLDNDGTKVITADCPSERAQLILKRAK